LYVVLSVRKHEFFERRGHDLYCVIPVSFPQAALGAEFEIPGIGGQVEVKIPEGTQSGRELRIKGRGVPHLNERGQGDLVVRVMVQTPRKLSKAQRELMAKLGETMSVDNKPTAPSLLERVKDLFN
jgi:molecular chaperone DnaJ